MEQPVENLRRLARDTSTPLARKRKRKRPSGHRNNQSAVDPAEEQRQYEAFELRASGASIRQITDSLGMSAETALRCIEAEASRRLRMRSARDTQVLMSVTRYEGVIVRALTRIQKMTAAATAKGANETPKYAFLEEKLIIEAQKRIDAIQCLIVKGVGVLEQPKPGENEVLSDIERARQTYNNLPEEVRMAVLLRARQLKGMKNVTPLGS